jgi:O-antigen/teichoic acid export membrane protein
MFVTRTLALRSLAQRPAFLVTFQVVFVQAFTVAVFAIQAPLLGPRAFGLIALVMIAVGFCESVVTGVATETLISVRDIDDLHYATATWTTVAFSLLLGLAMFFASAGAARLFGDPDLSPVLRWMSALPLLSALWAAPTAKTKRDMEFKPTVTRSIASFAVSGLVGIALALAGAGVWALVCQALLHRLIGAVALWLAVPMRIRLSFSLRHFRELRRIAMPLVAARCMAWASGQIPRFILGFFLGVVDLGLYSLGARFTDILVKLTIEPRAVIARIAFRDFAVERRGLEDSVRRLFLMTSAICFPLCVGGAVIVPTLFRVWLDARWQGGIVPVQLLLLSCIPYVTFYCATAILLAFNERGAEAVTSTLQAVAVAVAVLIAAPFGLDIASGAFTGALFVLVPVPLILLKRRCKIAIGPILRAQLPAFTASLLMGVAVWLFGGELRSALSGATRLIVLVLAGGVIYVAAISALAPEFVRDGFRSPAKLTNGAVKTVEMKETG